MSTVQTIYQIPGPTGTAGADGTDGAAGSNAFTTTTAGFVMPAEAGSVTIAVSDSSWASVGQVVYINGAGHFEVTAAPTSTQLTIKNLEVTASSEYTGNVAPATAVGSGAKVSPAGLQGPAGANGTSGADSDAYYVVTRAADAPANGVNLGLLTTGLVKVTVAAAVATPSTATPSVDYMVPTDVGTIAAQAANNVAITGGSITGITDLAVADGGTGASTAANARTNLGLGTSAVVDVPITKANGGTGVIELPYISVNRGGTDQTGVATATPTKIAFNTEIADSGSDFDTSTNRFTPGVAGAYAFTIAAQVNNLAATGDIVQVHLYKNAAVIATAKGVAADAADAVQPVLHFVAAANGTTDYFEAFVEHDSGVNQTVEGDEEVTFFCAHWCG